ncbi:MAG: hypothetical protein G01um101438_350 [Parcubacteria group bacterium Gr01-1014_38]|nr:MAG: hypothetical protein G01um101438_350 [Parcubacteria group bacterium Gr01-1014_38]
MNKRFLLPTVIAILVLGYFVFASPKRFFNFSPSSRQAPSGPVNEARAAQFEYLSKNGNSSCSASFKDSIASIPDMEHLRGSCCSPMSLHRYSEQVEGLKKYAHITEIPSDPYNIEAGLAKKLMAMYDAQLTSEQQQAYDYAMEHSSEKGPCCCKCWRWYVYGGLGKLLIQKYGFTGEQVTEVWNFSDGCGGDSEHHHS